MRRRNGIAFFIGAWLVAHSNLPSAVLSFIHSEQDYGVPFASAAATPEESPPAAVPFACISDSDGDGVCDNVDTCPDTIPGATVDANGCPPLIPGDFNRDGDVDPDDVAVLHACRSGPAIPVEATPGCQGTDFDDDADVDMDDLGVVQRCFSGANIPASPNCVQLTAAVVGAELRIIGTPASDQLALRLWPGVPTILLVDIGNDGSADFAFSRAAFDHIVVDVRGGDDLVWIDEVNGVFTDTEITTINGGSGNDTLIGGSGAERYIGGDGDDSAYMGAGNDRFVWNPGDDTDLIEGSDGIDTVEVNGGDGAEDFTVFANGTRVRFDRINPAPFFLDIGTCENLMLNANGGNDTLSCTGNLAALIQITADGGPGDDTLLGSNGADVLIGGADNDFIDGQQGNDVVFMGAGDDTFQWDPGDGSDTIEGQAGADTLIFNGSGASEIYDLSANGSRLRLTRNVGTIVMDLDDVERVDVNALGGADIATVNSLAGTDVTQVNIDLSTFGGVGDAQADSVNIIGTPAADVFNIFADSGFVVVDLAAEVRVKGYEAGDQVVLDGVGGDQVNVNGSAGADTMTVISNGTQARVDATGYSAGVAVSGALSLTINGLGGPDHISCTGNLAGLLIPITLDGGAGDDTLLGSNGADVLIGGADNDFIDGQQGNDVAFMGAGNDTFQWDPGDGSDTIEGQSGADTLVFNGSGANEIYDLSANGSRLRLTRNVGTIVMDLDDVEQVNLQALGGADSIVVNSLAGTDVTQVNIDLSTFGGVGDAQADSVNIIGTPAADVFNISADSGFVVVDLAADVRVKGYEAGDQVVFDGVGGDQVNVNGSAGADTMTVIPNGTQARVDATGYSAGVAVSGALSLTINGLGGPDHISCTGNLAGLLIPITLDGGAGDDTLLGSNGADVLIGGNDNDFVDGQQGNDVAFMGAGNDTFQWDPGDGSDTIEGQSGADTLVFNGSGASEIYDLSANGSRLRLTRNVGTIVMDLDDVEQVNLQALGGADSIVVNSLAGTDVGQVNVELAGVLGGTVGDALADVITVNGTAAPDTIHIAANAGQVEVSGLAAFVRIAHSEAALDSLIVNGLGGVDTITEGPGVAALILLTINQN